MESIINFFNSLRWQDILDIAINSYILFRLYVLFKGTNAFRIMLAIAFLWFFQEIANYLGLVVTSWLFQGFTAAAAIIIIVIFRHEIRIVFQTRNLKSILWGIPRRTDSTPIELLSEVVFELASSRTGALIVFQGKEDLTEIVKDGIPWQGLISREMIQTIFRENSPVHDGAILIDGRRVRMVGCILPLSHRKNLPSYFGTRHRAAVGLAEESDSLIIAVSEERGQVTVVRGNEIIPVRYPSHLIRLLNEFGGKAEISSEKFYRKERFNMIAAAGFSILIISAMWASFTRSLDTLITLDVPIRYLNRQPDMVVVETSTNTVRLYLSGSGALIRSVRPEQAQVSLDLKNAVVGKNHFPLISDNISLPPGINLSRIDPAVVDVVLDNPMIKELPIQVNWVGELSKSLNLSGVRLYPQTIFIQSRSMLLKNLETIYTEPVSLNNIQKSGTVKAGLKLNSALKIAKGKLGKITVQYIVQQKSQGKAVK